MALDGTLLFGTTIDNSGFNSGIGNLQLIADNAIGNIVSNIASSAANAVSQIPTQMVAVGSGFEAAMSQVAATSGITAASEDYKKLAAAAKDMGATTQFSASQAAEALNYLALAGYDANKSIATLPTILNVAASDGMELAAASDMITDAMSALGLQMDEVNTFANKLAVAAQKSNASVSQMGEAILTVGGTAKDLSGGVTELTTMLGVLADNGIKGAEGGTALRNMILSLSAPTNTASEALNALEVSAFNADGSMRPLQDTFADLSAALSDLSAEDRNKILSDIFNKVDLKSANALLGTSAERFSQLSGYIDDCDGAAEQMAKTMNDNLKGDITILQSGLEGLGISLKNFSYKTKGLVKMITVKKIIALLCSAAVITSAFTACSSVEESPDVSENEAAASENTDCSNSTVQAEVTEINNGIITASLGEITDMRGKNGNFSNNDLPDADNSEAAQSESDSDAVSLSYNAALLATENSGDVLKTPPEMPDGETPPEMPNGGTPPEMPNGETPPEMPDGETPPEMPDGETPPEMSDGETPPEKAESETLSEKAENAETTASKAASKTDEKAPKSDSEDQNGNSAKKNESKPEDESPSIEKNDGENFPDMPNGKMSNGKMPKSKMPSKSFSPDGRTAEIILSESTEVKLEAADGTLTDAAVENITVGSIVEIVVGESCTANAVTIKSSVRAEGDKPDDKGGFGRKSDASNGTAATTINSDSTVSDESFSSTGDNENALRVDGAKVNLDKIIVSKSTGSSDNNENGDFYGTNAAFLALNGAEATISDSDFSSDVTNGNAVFSYGEGTVVNISNSKIRTTGNNSGGIHTTGGAVMNATDLDVETSGNSSAAIRSDRGGGTVSVNGGRYVSNGKGSPAIYSTANISVSGASLTATSSEAVVVEGKNSVKLTDCTVSGCMSGTYNDSSENIHNIMIYQSMSGDAEVGSADFEMSGGTLTALQGDMFYVTNTSCAIKLSGTALTLFNDVLLRVEGGSRWGSEGKNGGKVEFTASAQELSGEILVDALSSLNADITDSSVFNGCINPDGQGGEVNLTLDSGSSWTLTADSYLSTFTNNGTLNCNGYSVYLADGTVLN